MPSHRIEKINELIRQELGKIFLREMNFPDDCLATITKVSTAPDLGQAKIYVSVMPAEQQEKILSYLSGQAGHLQFLLGKILVIRKSPKLFFYPDLDQQKIDRINDLIDKIHREQ